MYISSSVHKNENQFSKESSYLRMKGVDTVKYIHDASLDFIYINARHDYMTHVEVALGARLDIV
jgi:hypothetical protein